MDLQVLFHSLRRATHEIQGALRTAYRDDAIMIIIRDAIRLAEGRVPLEGQIALAAARLQVRLDRLQKAVTEAGDAAVLSADDAWVRAYWARPHANVSDEVLDRIRSSIVGAAPKYTLHRHNVLNILFETDQEDAGRDFLAGGQEWVKKNLRSVQQSAERSVVESAEIPEELGSDLHSVFNGESQHADARTVLANWSRGLSDAIAALKLGGPFHAGEDARYLDFRILVESIRHVRDPISCRTTFEEAIDRAIERFDGPVPTDSVDGSIFLLTGDELRSLRDPAGTAALMRLFDHIGVDPLTPASVVAIWRGRYNQADEWHLFDVGGKVVLVALDKRDPTWSQMLAIHGGVQDAVRWMSENYRSLGNGPVAVENPPTVADTLFARQAVERYRADQAACSQAWKEMTATA